MAYPDLSFTLTKEDAGDDGATLLVTGIYREHFMKLFEACEILMTAEQMNECVAQMDSGELTVQV